MFDSSPKKLDSVVAIPADRIGTSPHQTRRSEDEQALEALARSIASSGLINPITLRRSEDGGYIVVAGHRRLEACRRLGMQEIPSIVLERREEEAAAITVIENLHRRGLDCFEEARGIAELIRSCGMSQARVCGILGLSPSALCNKLRLLRLEDEVQTAASEAGVGERICRGLLRLPETSKQLLAIKKIAAGELSSVQAEKLIDSMMAAGAEKKRPRGILRDYRLIFSTVDRAVEQIRLSGIDVFAKKSVEERCICYTIRIPKAPAPPAEELQLSFFSKQTG